MFNLEAKQTKFTLEKKEEKKTTSEFLLMAKVMVSSFHLFFFCLTQWCFV